MSFLPSNAPEHQSLCSTDADKINVHQCKVAPYVTHAAVCMPANAPFRSTVKTVSGVVNVQAPCNCVQRINTMQSNCMYSAVAPMNAWCSNHERGGNI